MWAYANPYGLSWLGFHWHRAHRTASRIFCAVGSAVAEGVPVGLAEGVALAPGTLVGVSEGEALGRMEAVADGAEVPVGDSVLVAEGEGEQGSVPLGVGLGVLRAEGGGLSEWVLQPGPSRGHHNMGRGGACKATPQGPTWLAE